MLEPAAVAGDGENVGFAVATDALLISREIKYVCRAISSCALDECDIGAGAKMLLLLLQVALYTVAQQLSAATRYQLPFACWGPAALTDVTQRPRCFSAILAADAV